MPARMSMSLPVLILWTVLLPAAETPAEPMDEAAGIEFFEKHIRPVLVTKCYSCHSAESKEVKGNLLLDTREGIRRGGDLGHAVVPGNLDDSLIIEALRHDGLEMPPEEQLPETVIARFEEWIKLGAPDPRDGKSAPIRRVIDFEKAREFWAFQPIASPAVPQPRNAPWAQTDIDRFVLAQLESKSLQPVADAEPQTLIRRLYFDLTGLPPAPEQVAAFVADPSPAAYEQLVDELLASPRFGERWGRHWLDVVRYGESTGMDRNFTYPHAWRYRDYVIQAFNDDKPFDQFVHEQIAGDLLKSTSPEQFRNRHIATGVLAMGPKSLNERNRELFRLEVVDEQIDVTSQAFLGLTVSCARCHDHKFDPIPTSEYYSLAGVFLSTDTYYGTVNQNGNRQPGELLALSDDRVNRVAASPATARNQKPAKPAVQNVTAGDLEALQVRAARLEKNASNAKQKQRLQELKEQIARLEKQANKERQTEQPAEPQPAETPASATTIMGVLDHGSPANAAIRLRGEPDERGKVVDRGFLTIASLSPAPAIPADQSGRLQYAEWITAKDNPLTARVAVNRVWQHLLGKGIVATVNNFGANGDRPTHPELLDYLAGDFVKRGWSTKTLVRQIVLSRVYRLGSSSTAQGETIDPDNNFLWRANQRRLEAEAIRDAMLLASGQLDLTPPTGSVVHEVGDGNVGQGLRESMFIRPSSHRSVYLPIVRGVVPELLQVFDFPEPSIISGERDVTTVPTQALYMLNSPFVLEQSRQLAERINQDSSLPVEQKIELAYQHVLCRQPTSSETDNALKYLRTGDSPSLWTGFCQALFASSEFRYVQ